MDDTQIVRHSVVIPELYFLISKFLSDGPLKKTAKVLAEELEQFKILPKRLDWTGEEHEQTFEELESKYSHIGPQHILEICSRIGPILDKEVSPSVTGVISLLGAGRQSLLRTSASVSQPRSLLDHCSRRHGAPLFDVINRKNQHNIVRVLYGRQFSGPITRRVAIQPSFYNKLSLVRTTLGHLTAVYCVLFDRSGKYIITGADDLLVKLWSAIDGRLLATFRGASAEITDITVNLENTLLAAGSLDRILRVWDMQTCAPIAVLTAHTGMITSVNFCPSPRGDLRYLVTTSTDGSIAFWQYTTPRGGKTVFASKPIQYLEKLRPGQAKMICASFSSGGLFLAAGSADNHVRVYMMSEEGPKRILEIESHLDTVDSIQWSHTGLRFVSGSKDGTAQIWHFETQQWKNTKLNMSDRLPGAPPPEDENKKYKVTMVAWDLSDKWIITAVSDHTIKVWNSTTCKLHKVLEGHTDEVYVLEAHPKDANICLSAGHDGQLFVWDVFEGTVLCKFKNFVEHQMHGGIYDSKWSPDGLMIAATDSHGHILMFTVGNGHERLKVLPKELFFHTDYRPLIRDSNFYVMDEQTQTAPHLMPPPFLVDIDGNPHEPRLQTLVPGRENCPIDQLVPNLEAYEPPDNQARSDIDRLIEALANRQGNQGNLENQNEGPNVSPENSNNSSRTRNSFNRSVSRRSAGPAEDPQPRAGTSNWQPNRSTNATPAEQQSTFKYVRRTYVRPMNYANLQHLRQTVYHAGVLEQELHRREMRKRPVMINTSNINASNAIGRTRGRGLRNNNQAQPAYRTRNTRAREPLPEEEEEQSSSSSSSSDDSTAIDDMDLSEDSSSSGSESSDYSDWVANEPGPANLQPPKRSKRKPVERRTYSPTHNEASTSAQQPSTSQDDGNSRQRRKKLPIPANGGEIPEIYRPPEWLSAVIPRKAPYYPQMGDEVIYLREGHQKYLDAVRSKKVYDPGNRCEPWGFMDLQAHELCKVIGIKYEIKPPRLCCLKLGIMEDDGHLTGQSFTIKYHDMPDVLDFLVLRQTFETAVSRNWGAGDRFRCMIDDSWWMGQIDSLNKSTEFPDSLFMCFKVRWDNGEFEYMSPWDLEQIDENRMPTEVGGSVQVLPEELNATLYQPSSDEWPNGDRDATCQRIIRGLEQVIGLAIADPFLVPVDLSIYPAYAFVVEYPIDLTTIKARFENRFYRRITSAQFDVRYLATNAEKFNQSHSNIVKHARIITEICLRILSDPYPINVSNVYHQLVDSYVSSESDAEGEPQPGPSTRPSGSRRSRRLVPDGDWRAECRELLEMIWQHGDSEPFREPVDTLEHPDYLQVIESPMDLRTIKEDLLGDNYETPLTFAKDMRLIFHNSRSYNTNKRSRIYAMTLRLSTLFEAHIKSIIYNWKSAKRRTKTNPQNNKKQVPAKRTSQRRTQQRTRTRGGNDPGAGPSTSTARNDDHETSEMEVDPLDISSPRVTRKRHAVRAGGSREIRRSSRSARTTRRSQEEEEDDEEEDDDDATVSNTSSSSDRDSSPGAVGVNGRPIRKVRQSQQHDDEVDSGESYKPYGRNARSSNRKRGKRRRTVKSSATSTPVKRKQRKNTSDDDQDNQEEDSDNISGFADGQASEQSTDSDESSDDNKPIGRTRQSKAIATSDHSERSDKRRTRRSRRYESDQSYHEEQSNSRKKKLTLAESEESDHEGLHATRASTRRAQQAWGQATDSLEDDEPPPPTTSQRRLRTRKLSSESEHSPEETSISKRVISSRNTRSSRRNEPVDPLEQPSTSSGMGRSTRTRQGTSNQSTSLSPFMDAPRSETNSENLTRSGRRMMPLRSQVGFSNAQQNHRAILPHEVDHNYGEPRRPPVPVLSRHQRSVDELENQDESESLSSRLRHRTLVNNSLRTSTRITRHSQTTNTDQNSDSDDDNTPLNRLQSNTGINGEPSSSSSSRPQRNTRRSRLHESDDDHHHDEPGPSSGRSTRKQKRPHYNEETDEETMNGQRPPKRQALASGSENEDVITQVSSRGRIRRIKAKARGIFKE